MTPFEQKRADALEASIEKWEANLIARPERMKIYSSSCPLCELFQCRCNGCPVYERTREHRCANTPWEDVAHLHHALQLARVGGYLGDGHPMLLELALREHIRQEIEFLKSLRVVEGRDGV